MFMNKKIAVLASLLLLFTGTAFAAGNDTTTINYSVAAINEVNIDDDMETFRISTATAGVQPNAEVAAGSYDITTNGASNTKKLTAALNGAMPAGTALTMAVTAPTGGTSAGAVTLTALPQDVVTAIDGVAEADIAISYSFSATVAAGVIEETEKTIMVTLTES